MITRRMIGTQINKGEKGVDRCKKYPGVRRDLSHDASHKMKEKQMIR